jgi:hypothetical protein
LTDPPAVYIGRFYHPEYPDIGPEYPDVCPEYPAPPKTEMDSNENGIEL